MFALFNVKTFYICHAIPLIDEEKVHARFKIESKTNSSK